MAFYEKVIKVKADVAAYLINCFPSAWPSGDVGSCQGRPRTGGVHLDPWQLPMSLTIELGTKRNAVQLDFVP